MCKIRLNLRAYFLAHYLLLLILLWSMLRTKRKCCVIKGLVFLIIIWSRKLFEGIKLPPCPFKWDYLKTVFISVFSITMKYKIIFIQFFDFVIQHYFRYHWKDQNAYFGKYPLWLFELIRSSLFVFVIFLYWQYI